MKKEIDNSSFIDEYYKAIQSNNKRDIQETSNNKQEKKLINDLSTNTTIIIDINNKNHTKNEKSKNNIELFSIKNIKNDLNQTKIDNNGLELINDNNNCFLSSF